MIGQRARRYPRWTSSGRPWSKLCALPAVRKTGVLENEAELLHGCITAVKESVLKAYPSHELTAVGDWMLLAAIEALIDEQDYLANYHLAWYAVTTRRGGSRGFAA
ncbi:DUF5631 domain-containing protein [Mycobacterium tuberculosis]